MNLTIKERGLLKATLGKSGMRFTRQRELIYEILMEYRDHPTAEELYARAKKEQPGISLATVYNGLEALTSCDLIRQVHFERSSTRFCPNLAEHAHFQCEQTGKIFDIPLETEAASYLKKILPEGYSAHSFSLSYAGKSPFTEKHSQEKKRYASPRKL